MNLYVCFFPYVGLHWIHHFGVRKLPLLGNNKGMNWAPLNRIGFWILLGVFELIFVYSPNMSDGWSIDQHFACAFRSGESCPIGGDDWLYNIFGMANNHQQEYSDNFPDILLDISVHMSSHKRLSNDNLGVASQPPSFEITVPLLIRVSNLASSTTIICH